MKDQLNLLDADRSEEVTMAFNQWAAAQTKLSETSIATYRFMWQSYAQFLVRADTSLHAVTRDDLELFLQGLEPRGPYADEINEHYAWRTLSLIKRVTAAEARRTNAPENREAHQLLQTDRFRYTNARGKEPLPKILAPQVARGLIQKLVAQAEAIHLKPTWKLERDRACLALMLGSGLTPMELRQLSTSDLFLKPSKQGGVPWKLSVPPTAKTVAHEAPIAGWARRVLARWLQVRETHGFASDVLFPATSSAKPWTDVGCQAAVTATLTQLLGDQHHYGGLLRLRHTFVIRQRKRQVPLDRIALWLGIRDLERMRRYESVIPTDIEVA